MKVFCGTPNEPGGPIIDSTTKFGGHIPPNDSLRNQKLNIIMGNTEGASIGYSKSILDTLKSRDTLFNQTFSANNPIQYIRIKFRSDSDSNVFNAVYMLDYYAIGGCIQRTVKLIPDSNLNFISDSFSNYHRFKDTVGRGNPPGILDSPLVNSMAMRNRLKNIYTQIGNPNFNYCNITLKVTPIIKNLGLINNESDLLPSDDKIVLRAPTGFPRAVYRWQYRLQMLSDASQTWSSNYWINFPDSLNYKETIVANAKDLLGPTWINWVNKPIYIRIVSCDSTSDIVIKNIRLSAPKVTSITPTPTKCSYSADGKVKVMFDRPAFRSLNEQLFLIFNKLEDQKKITVYTDTLGTTDTMKYISPTVLPAGDYEMQLYGTLSQNNIKTPTFNACYHKFTIQTPDPVSFETVAVPVRCIGNKDGSLKIIPNGGCGKYDINIRRPRIADSTWKRLVLHYDTIRTSFDTILSAGYHYIDTLKSDTLFIALRDTNICYAREEVLFGSVGKIIVDTIIIGKPIDSIRVFVDTMIIPKAYGFKDGRMHLRIKGGTVDAQTGKYQFIWKDATSGNLITVNNGVWYSSAGISLGVVQEDYMDNGTHHIGLKNLYKGVFRLEIKDYFYNTAIPNTTCFKAVELSVAQPDSFTITFDDVSPSCNAASGQIDFINNGTMTAHVRGGVPFKSGMPYQYNWQKYNSSMGAWEPQFHNDSIYKEIGEGSYRLNIMDANGIIRGTYSNNTLVSTRDMAHDFHEPSMLAFSPAIIGVGCTGTANGSILPNVSGGTPSYTYLWDNGSTSSSISSLSAGVYNLIVKDAHGCEASQNFTVSGTVSISALVVDANCKGASNGSVQIIVNNSPPGAVYTYNWITPIGALGNQINNVGAGTYEVSVNRTMPMPACQVRYRVKVKEPAFIPLNIPSTYVLCNQQTVGFDINLGNQSYIYSWIKQPTGQFVSSTSKANVSQSGNYEASVTNQNGCVIAKQNMIVSIDPNHSLDAELLLPTHAYTGEEVTLMDLSTYRADSILWTFPRHLIVKGQDSISKLFYIDTPGTYSVTLTRKVSQCVAKSTKDIVVTNNPDLSKRGDGYQPFIRSATTSTNGNGDLVLDVKFREVTNANFKIYSIIGYSLMSGQSVSGFDQYTITFNTSNLVPGTYMLLIETPQEWKVLKFIR
jgi:hypothetical protein